jgi:RNA polymerase-binding transcription factor DksA
MTIDTENFKKMLVKERETLESELSTVGRKNPDNKSDWEAVEGEVVTDTAEEGDVAEGITEYENNSAVLDQLEKRLNEVKVALGKIETGKYGICEVCGEEIESDRLEANTSATTCKKHMGA